MMKLRYRKLSVLLAAGLTASLLASTPGFAEGLESVQESQVEEAQEEGQEEEQEEYSEEEGPEETQEEETQEETQEAETPEEEYQEDEYYTDIDDADTEYDVAYYEDDSSTVESNVESAVEYTTNTTTGTTTSSDTTTTTTTTSGETTQSGTTSDAAAQSTANTTTQSSTTDAATQSTAPVEEEPKRPEYQALDYITLGDYKGLVVEVDPIEITDEDIDERIAQEIRYSEEGTDTLTEGTVEEGDIANIDFEGKKDGVAFDGGTAEGYDLEIGSGSFIDGFEDGLIGVAIGDTVDLDLTFPENYGNEDLAGQDVVFTVTVNSIDRVKELDDELASLLSDGEATTVDEYREYIKGILEEEALEERKSQVEMDLLTQAAENITVDTYPQDLVDYEIDQLKDYYQYYATIYGMDLGTLLSSMLGITEEEFPEQAAEMVKENIRQEFCIDAIAETESLLPTGEELAAAYDELAEKIGYEDGKTLVDEYGEYAVKYTVAHDLVMDFLYDNADIVETSPESEAEAAESEVESEAEAESESESEAESATSETESAESEAADSTAAESEAASEASNS